MAKEIITIIKLQASGGKATPAPPIGPALGQHGVNIGQFVSQFNEKTKEMNGTTVPVVITVYRDKSFTFEVKSPPAAVLLKQAAEVAKEAAREGVSVREIVEKWKLIAPEKVDEALDVRKMTEPGLPEG